MLRDGILDYPRLSQQKWSVCPVEVPDSGRFSGSDGKVRATFRRDVNLDLRKLIR